jgi:hypothetical protein
MRRIFEAEVGKNAKNTNHLTLKMNAAQGNAKHNNIGKIAKISTQQHTQHVGFEIENTTYIKFKFR